jgi:CRISPR type III-B/RAMP module RAMP protein Cmr6
MLHRRFRSDEIDEDINEADCIMVTGAEIFNQGKINRWIDGEQNQASFGVNLSLLLNKYPWWFRNGDITPVLEKKFGKYKLRDGNRIPNRSGGFETKEERHDYKNEMFKDIVQCIRKKPEHYDDLKDRHYSAPFNSHSLHIVLTSKTQLISGLSGSSTVYETHITLHPYYGFPVIPASSIKGDIRHFCEEHKQGEIDDESINRIFGSEDTHTEKASEGEVVFYDGWPEIWPTFPEKPMLEIANMTPHYKDYYDKSRLPKDNQKTVPINFLVVRKGIQFRFAVRPSSNCKNSCNVSLALALLKETLTTVGIGAKTGSSFGYFCV